MTALHAVRALVTRPDPAGSLLCERIREQGGEAFHFPTIAFAEPSDNERFRAAVAAVGECDWLIFISPQAVYASVSALRTCWPHLPPKLKLAAIGTGTAAALKRAGYTVAVTPEAEWSTEGLMAMPAFAALHASKVGIVRGEGGRELLEKILIERGADVLHVIAYQRILPDVDVEIPRQWLQASRINVIICGSFEAVNNLKIVLGESSWSYLRCIPLIVMSERIKALAHDLGFQTIWVGREPITALTIHANEINGL